MLRDDIYKHMYSDPEHRIMYEEKAEAFNTLIELGDKYGMEHDSILRLVQAVEKYDEYRFKFLVKKIHESI